MELRDIEYFAAIGEHGHLGRAAEALQLTQPALSKSLRRLEQAVGAKLVKRTPRHEPNLPQRAREENGIFGLRIAMKTSYLPLRDQVVACLGNPSTDKGVGWGRAITQMCECKT